MDLNGSFPLMFMHGGKGSGKSSTAKLFMKLNGYKDTKPFMCDMKPFPMLKLLSSTNAIPVFLDEFKASDMREGAEDNLLRYMRKAYDGEIEEKGQQDLSVQDFTLKAPMVVIGEWSISQPAIKERIIFPRFSDKIKTDKKMQTAFESLRSLPLEGFMPKYVQFVLGQDIRWRYSVASRYVKTHLSGLPVAPRVIHNLSVLVMGIKLFRDYGKYWKVSVPDIDLKAVLDAQLRAITGTNVGQVKSAVDQLIEGLAIMAQLSKDDFGMYGDLNDRTWFKECPIRYDSNPSVPGVAIAFNLVYPVFSEYARRTNYGGDKLDKESYQEMFADTDYIAKTSEPVNMKGKTVRCIVIDIEKAKARGLDIEGLI